MPSRPAPTSTLELATRTDGVANLVERELARTGGLLRLAPCWVPRSFLQPGLRLKLHPDDTYAFGLDRGGIDERWFASTTEAANDNRTPDEGLSYAVIGGERCTLRQAVAECGAALIGERLWKRYGKWPVYAKFFDNMGPIPHHMHQDDAQAALVGREGKPEAYYFPLQHNPTGNRFPYTFMGSRRARRRRRSAVASSGGTRATTGSSTSPRPTASRSAPAGSCRRGCCTPRVRSAPTSRNGAPTSSRCTSRWSRAVACRGNCS
jgi:hypothetical protein